jgi:hypothetical protein
MPARCAQNSCCTLAEPADVLTPTCPIEWVKVKGAGESAIPITEAYSLTAMLTPTPRWPDAMCVVDPVSKVVFSGKLFSAHVAPGLVNTKVRGCCAGLVFGVVMIVNNDTWAGLGSCTCALRDDADGRIRAHATCIITQNAASAGLASNCTALHRHDLTAPIHTTQQLSRHLTLPTPAFCPSLTPGWCQRL